MNRVDIKIGFNCNNKCQFCVQGDKRFKFQNKKIKEIKQSLSQANKTGIEGVVFTGGEPTLHQDIIEAIKYAKALGFKHIQLQTNGRMLAYENFCQELIAAGVNEFSPALHSSKPEIHDELTSSPGAWQQVVAGIKNLKSLNQFVLTNTVITSKNYQDLPGLAQLFIDLDVDQFQFAFVHILGTAKKNKDWLVPRKSEIMPYVKKGLRIGNKAGKIVMTEAIPYCLMKNGFENYVAEKIIPETKVVDAEGVIESYKDYRWNKGKVKRKACKKCKYFRICEGPWKEYPEIYGWQEFKPVMTNNFIKFKNFNKDLINKLMHLYDLNNFKSAYKYKGHSCNNVHLLKFENNSVIIKINKFDKKNIIKEKELIERLNNRKFKFPQILNNKFDLPYFGYKNKLVKVYEFMPGNKVYLKDNIDLVINFLKQILKHNKVFNFQTDIVFKNLNNKLDSLFLEIEKNNIFKKLNLDIGELIKKQDLIKKSLVGNQEIILYHNIEIIDDGENRYILESEHLGEELYPLNYALAKYLIDILDDSIDDIQYEINLKAILNKIILGANINLQKKDFASIKFFLLIEIVKKIKENLSGKKNQSLINKYIFFYNHIFDNF
jgi:MoaA/NifB/PqqE/SkfB family radical SAM enzyme